MLLDSVQGTWLPFAARSLDISAAFFDRLRAVRDAVLPDRMIAWLARPSGVWWGFALVHLYYLVWMGAFALRGEAFSDTEQYRNWAMAGYGVDSELIGPWVYPVLAQVPIFLAGLVGHDWYVLAWTIVITLLDAIALWLLLRGDRAERGVAPAWWWLLFTALMGYLSFARMEGVVVPIALAGMLFAARHPVAGSVVLSIATWIKVWPAAAILALVIASRRRLKVIAAGVAVSLLVVLGTWLSGGLSRIADFALNQGTRGMQLEATFSTPWVWLTVFGMADSRIAGNAAINSTEVYGPGTAAAAALMQPVLLVAVAVGALLLVRAVRNGSDPEAAFYEGTLMLTLILIVFNKVGSPQFMLWLAPVMVAGLVHDWRWWRGPAALLMGIAAITFLIYPLFYSALAQANPLMAIVLTVRNLLVAALLWWSVRRVWELGSRHPRKPSAVAAPTG